jgi:WD40 repeat protein/tRNA A-37 threonylcarbamoyl transferase component Bud32
MGRVVSALDGELCRQVALKFHSNGDGDTRLQRSFLEEAQITGQLDHPGIVPIHEFGVGENGEPFFAMRLVRGCDLGEVLEQVRSGADGWTRTRVLHVLLRVCEAMAYAHAKGVVHRDLKPSNVMVGRFGEVYVMDWGLARVVGQQPIDATASAVGPVVATLRGTIAEEDDASPLLTQHGDVVGTPAYMAPELVDGGSLTISPAADVYAIGAILHHLCVGHIPYVPPGERPSVAEVLARVRAGPPGTLPADLPVELRAIHDRAMARAPFSRYPSMIALADDLRAYLELRVVSAYATGPWAELRKWLARNRALSIAVASAVVALVVGVIVSTRLWVIAAGTAAELNTELDRSEFRNARLSLDLDDAGSAEDLLWGQHFSGRMPRATAWALTELQARSPCLVTVASPTAGENPIAIAHDTGEVLVGGVDGRVRVLAADDLSVQRVLGEAGPSVLAVAFVPAHSMVLLGSADGAVTGIDFTTGRVQRRLATHGSAVRALAVAPDGHSFASGGADGRVLLWLNAAADPIEAVTHPGTRLRSLAFDQDGKRLASGGDDGSVYVTELANRSVAKLRLGTQQAMTLLFVPGVDQLWVGSAGHTIFVMEMAPMRLLRTMPTRNGTCRDLALDTEGAVLAGGWWRVDRFAIDATRGVPITLRGIWQFEVDAARHRLVTTHRGRGISVIDRAEQFQQHLPGHQVALSGDGRQIALSLIDRVVVRSLDAPQAIDPASIAPFSGWLAIDQHGERVAVCAWGQARVEVFDVANRRALFTMAGPVDPPFNESMAFRGDGRELAVVAGTTLVRRVDATTGAVRGEHPLGPGQIVRLRYSADGNSLAVISRGSHSVRLLSLNGGMSREVELADQPAAVALSSDARLVAVGNWQGVVTIIDVYTDERREIRAHGGTTFSLEFAPRDPRLLISSGGANGITFWDLDTGVACHSLLRDEAPVTGVQVSADGRTLVAHSVAGIRAIDLEYHERHVAGNLAYQLARLGGTVTLPPARETELRQWAAQVLERPWPRWPAR